MRHSSFHVISGWVIVPLRIFLGVTFVYAGVQKLTDPGFLAPGSGSYIGTQLLAYSNGSPIALLFHWIALPLPTLTGILVIVAELAIGLGALLGLATRLAALGGLALNLTFFLSATWQVTPYFMGADIVFVMCWLTLAIAGPGPLALDALIASAASSLRVPRQGTVDNHPTLSRQEALVALSSTVGLLLLALLPRAGLSAQLGSKRKDTATSRWTAVAATSGAVRVGTTASVSKNSALSVTDPKTGDPALVVHLPGSGYVAYDAVCTHAGCTVGYDPATHLLVCPCHGAAYDPARDAQVVAGPAPRPLSRLPMTIDRAGVLYLYGTPGRPPHAPKPAQSSDDGESSDD